MVLFIEKTWFLWWMLAIVIGLGWFHLVSANVKLLGLEAQALAEGRLGTFADLTPREQD